MLRCLALCNTVATVAPDAGGPAAAAGVAYEAASPDEEALVRPLPSPPSLLLPFSIWWRLVRGEGRGVSD